MTTWLMVAGLVAAIIVALDVLLVFVIACLAYRDELPSPSPGVELVHGDGRREAVVVDLGAVRQRRRAQPSTLTAGARRNGRGRP